MHTLFRTLAATAVLSAMLIAGTSSALAASGSGNGATVERYDFDEEWCFDFGDWYDCTVVDAKLFVTTTPGSRSQLRITYREVRRSYTPDGTAIGTLRVNSFDKSVYSDDGDDRSFTVEHARGTGPFGRCVTTYHFRIVDFELKTDRYVGPGCS